MKKLCIMLIFCLLIFTSAAYGQSDYFDSLEARAVYVDDSSTIKMLVFKINEMPENMTVSLNSRVFDIDAPFENGMVYQSITADITAEDSIELTFSAGSESAVLTAPVIKIVEGKSGEWVVSDDGHSLLTYLGSSAEVIAPNFYNNKPIIIIGGNEVDDSYVNILNQKSSGIKKLTLSDGITAIYHYAFYGIGSLEEVVFPNTLRSVGGVSFYKTGLKGALKLPASTRTIYSNAFRDTKITSLKLNEGLEKIGAQAFVNCTAMSGTLELPSTLTEIGRSAFYNCPALTGDLIIPSGVKRIEEGTFFKCGGFNGRLVLSEGVEYTGYLSFGNYGAVNNFTSLELPSTLKQIGPYCFQNCSKIAYLTLNDNLEIISDGAFDHCSGLENEKIVIPASVKTIGGDHDVKTNTGYGDHVFYDAGKDSSLKAFEVSAENPYFCAVDGVLYDKALTRLIAYPRGKTDTELILPDTVTQLDALSFSRPAYLKRLYLPDNFVVSTDIPANSLNTDGNTLSIALYTFTGLEEIAVSDENPNYSVKDGVLYSKDMQSVWYIPQGIPDDIVIQQNCKRLEKGCIYISNLSWVKWPSLQLPSSLEYVDADVLQMLNETTDSTRTVNLGQRVSYSGDMYIVYIKGDADLSGKVDENDARTVLYAVSRGESVFSTVAADMNRDGKVDVRDAVLILGQIES